MATDLTPGAVRVLDAASDLFYDRGLHAVGVDTIAQHAGVTKKTIYDRFGSKDALAVAYLRRRDDRWRELLAAARAVEPAPGARRLLALFDAGDSWHDAHGGRGCAAINARAETPDVDHPVAQEVTRQKAWVLAMLRDDARAAGARDPDALADGLLLLYEGALATSGLGTVADPMATARRAAALLCAASGVAAP